MKSRYNRNCTRKPYSSKYSHFGEIGCYIRGYLSPSAENMYYLHLNILPFFRYSIPPASLSFGLFPSLYPERFHLYSLLYRLPFPPIWFELLALSNYTFANVQVSADVARIHQLIKNTPTVVYLKQLVYRSLLMFTTLCEILCSLSINKRP